MAPFDITTLLPQLGLAAYLVIRCESRLSALEDAVTALRVKLENPKPFTLPAKPKGGGNGQA